MAWRDFFRTKAPALSDTYRDQPSDVVVTHDINEHWQSVLEGKRWNPDDLVGAKGLPIYSKMLVDEQVKSVTEFKLNAILGRGYQFKFPGKTKLSKTEQAERIAVFETVLRKMRGSFVDALEGIASGREFGFSITEKVYGDIEVESKTYTGINMLLTRDPGSFDFYADDYGLLKKIEQRTSKAANIHVDRDKVIHYVHKPKWDLIYGRSELRSAYRAWYAKDQLVKLWLMHLEKFGSGVWKAMQDTEASLTSNSPEYVALKAALANVRALSSIILPPGITAEVEFPSTTDQYEKALQYFDLAIAKSQLVPNLLGLSHTGQTGAYSQSQTQFEAFFWTTSADGSRLSECLNEELFRDLGDQNWGDGEYPSFCFKPVSVEHIKWMLTAWKDLLGIKAVIATEEDERVIRQLLEMPERDPDAEPLVDPMAERQQTHTEEQAAVANERADKEMQLREKEATKKAMMSMQAQLDELKSKLTSAVNVTVHNPAPSPPATTTDPSISNAGSEGGRVVPHGKLRSSTLEQFTRASLRVNFSVIEKRTDDFAESAIPTLATIVAKAARRALGDDANMAALIDEDPADVAALDLNGADRGKLKSACRDLLVQSWTLGSELASNEIQRARGERMAFAERRAQFVSLRDNAAAYFETQSFRMAGDTSDQVKKIIQQELQNGIKFGKTIPEVRVAIWERLVAKGLTTLEAVRGTETSDPVVEALNDLQLQDVADVAPYLNTLVRTNTFEALNEARYAEFTDPAVADFVEGLEYAAVLDASTTTICRELNGKVYRADSPEWDSIRPPNHFNCRSVLVPITVIDGWDGQESPPSNAEPAEGFK
jgi:SPP1 gp7 family putative phage head morphogenesis protein